jgi:5-methylcytosine-specific restriction protein A
VCNAPGCPTLTAHGRCPAHQGKSGGRWHSQHAAPPARVTGRKLQRLRDDLFARQPFCQVCRVRVADVRDHIVPLAEGGTDTEDNVQAACQECSDLKTQAEARRGRERMSGGEF